MSYTKLPREVQSALKREYPEGMEEATFDFRLPTQNEVYRALRFCWEEVNYLVKIERKRLDRPDVLDVIYPPI